MPFGAELQGDGRTHFRLWAPSARSVELVLGGAGQARHLTMPVTVEGWHDLTIEAPAGSRYRYRIDRQTLVPDPASRSNPDDVHGASEIVDPRAYDWNDGGWRGRAWSEAVVYELHVGTFTPEGTFAAVESRLDHLVKLGVTAIELMPLADFPGKRNWGYDGVLQFAPDATYGRPEDLKRLIDAAHARGLMMLLDVVYNHFGPEGNYLHAYAAPFFTDRHKTAWGAAINFDGAHARPVRDFFVHNALYWLEEFHFDGLRFDAVHAIVDDSTPHILVELAEAVRNGPGLSRNIHLVLENERNEAHYLDYTADTPRWYSAQWNDDEHHAFHVMLTGEQDGYYADYAVGSASKLGRCLTEGFAYQGEPSSVHDGKSRGERSDHLPPLAFVTFLQNHDQIGNRAHGERLITLADRARLRAATAAWLLAPAPPMLFMGEEFGATTPFLFFCDFGPELARAVTEGRRREFAGFQRFASEAENIVPDPNEATTFERSKLQWTSLPEPAHAEWLDLYATLLRLRRERIAPRLGRTAARESRCHVLGDGALAVEWRLEDRSTLRLFLNLSDSAVRVATPAGDHPLHCEPSDAARALASGELPPRAAGVYLAHAEPVT